MNKSLAKKPQETCILVTGGAGYIGSHTCVELLNLGYRVVVVDDLSNSSEVAINRVRSITGCSEERLAFYTLTKTISILPVMERFEPVLSAALFLGMFCMAALLADSCAQTASRAAGKRKKKWEVWAVCAAALALSKPVRAMPEAVWSAGAVAFWGLAPILAQVVVGIKKVKKKAKKGLTNAGDFGNIAERSREGSESDVRLEQNRRKDEKSS